MSDPKRERLKARADLLHELSLEADDQLRAYDHRQDPHLFPAPYLTAAAEQEAIGEDFYERSKAEAASRAHWWNRGAEWERKRADREQAGA